MSIQVKYRRDTAANVAAFTGAQGEIVVDTTNNRLVVQDGVTAGGFAAAKLAEVPINPGSRIINGGMDVWNNSGSVSLPNNGQAYTAECWLVGSNSVGVPERSRTIRA